MSGRPASDEELAVLRRAVARLRAGVMAIVGGLLGGSALAVATAWLVLRGGPDVGRHLSLLSNYFPGYAVTWPGVVVGFAYAAAVGGAVGGFTAWVYNRIVDLRHRGHRSAE